MAYVLEDKKEFDRLERQSQTSPYDFKAELSDLRFPDRGVLLDAGCGSGIVTRHLAETYPRATIIGCDFSAERVAQANETVKTEPSERIRFEEQDLTRLKYPSNSFDVTVARFVLEHLPAEGQPQAVQEIFRTLKPGGHAHLIDIDGYLFNLFPLSPIISELLDAYATKPPVDLGAEESCPNCSPPQASKPSNGGSTRCSSIRLRRSKPRSS